MESTVKLLNFENADIAAYFDRIALEALATARAAGETWYADNTIENRDIMVTAIYIYDAAARLTAAAAGETVAVVHDRHR